MSRPKMPDVLSTLVAREPFESMTGPEFREYLIRTGKLVPRAERCIADPSYLDAVPCLRIGNILRGYRNLELPQSRDYIEERKRAEREREAA